jgi:hypothetical protein
MWDDGELRSMDLEKAATYGNLKMVQCFVLAEGVPANGRGPGTYVPFLCVAFSGKIYVMEWLLANGASSMDTGMNGVVGMNALLLSIIDGHFSAAEYLCCKCGASPATSRTYVGGTVINTVWTELQYHCLPISAQECGPNEVEPT